MKEEEKMQTHDHKGLLGWSFGLLSMIFSVVQPIAGLIFGIVGVITCSNQNKKYKDQWSRSGRTLSIIALIISVLLIIASIVLVKYFANYLSQIQPQLQ